jgi:hypothetical protein
MVMKLLRLMTLDLVVIFPQLCVTGGACMASLVNALLVQNLRHNHLAVRVYRHPGRQRTISSLSNLYEYRVQHEYLYVVLRTDD